MFNGWKWMKDFTKQVIVLLSLEIIVLISGIFMAGNSNPEITFINIALLSLGFLFTSFVSLLIFFIGRNRDADSQMKFLLSSFTVKFLTDLVLTFFWFFVAKKTSMGSLILFFILYLAFTILMMRSILKALKHKNL